MDLFAWITQACTTLTNTISPSIDSMGVHICIALATIMLVWFGIQEALASAQGGAGFSIGKFLNFFMLITFAYVMVKFYDSSIPGIGNSLKGFVNGGAQYLVGQIGTDSAANILSQLQQAEASSGPGMMSAAMNPYNAIIFAIIQVLISTLAALVSVIVAYGAVASSIVGLLGPIFIPFLVLDRLEFLFWGWLRAFLGFSFYKVVAAASLSILSQLLTHYYAMMGGFVDPGTMIKQFPVLILLVIVCGFILVKVPPMTMSVILVPSSSVEALQALRSLSRARETFARAPRLNKAAPEPTSWLLARFQDHLNMGRRDAAALLLDSLREELRLDALNLKALQVQLHATFDDWPAITSMQGFQNMTFARRTPAVTALLLEALYQVHIEPIFDSADKTAVEDVYANLVRPLALPMLTVPIPASLRNGGWRLFGLESLFSPQRADLRLSIEHKIPALSWLGDRLSPVPVEAKVEHGPLDMARELVVATENSESVDALAAALSAIAKLNEGQRLELSRAEPFSSAIRVVQQESVQPDLPTSWILWMDRLADPAFSNALDLARFGADEWSVLSDSPDPTEIRSLQDSIGTAQSNELAAERTAQALPFLVAALRRHPSFPSPVLAPICSSLLTILVLGAARGAAIYESSQVLIEGLLAVGLNQQDYRALADDVNELAGEGLGVDMIFWTLEVIEMFMRYAAPDVGARENLMHRLVARILAIRMRLSTLQLTALRRLVAEFGWVVDGLDSSIRQKDQDDFESRLKNKRIAIYSLLEAASRQAKVALEATVASLSVECNADSGGSARLRALAQNSDIFIIVWAAAKHAATDFIREHRGNKTLLYAQGKGFSSLLRALEDHFKLG